MQPIRQPKISILRQRRLRERSSFEPAFAWPSGRVGASDDRQNREQHNLWQSIQLALCPPRVFDFGQQVNKWTERRHGNPPEAVTKVASQRVRRLRVAATPDLRSQDGSHPCVAFQSHLAHSPKKRALNIHQASTSRICSSPVAERTIRRRQWAADGEKWVDRSRSSQFSDSPDSKSKGGVPPPPDLSLLGGHVKFSRCWRWDDGRERLTA